MSPAKVLTFVNKEVNMNLVRIARENWEVLAVLDARGRCQVLDFVEELGPRLIAAQKYLFHLLRVWLPVDGPPAHNSERCKPLGDGIFEIRRQHKGPKLRLLFFYDEGNRIIFTNAFFKAETTPQTELELARRRKKQYFEAKRHKRLHIEET